MSTTAEKPAAKKKAVKPTTVAEAAAHYELSEDVICPACLEPSGWLDGGPCMPCTRARAKAATSGKGCTCGNKRRPHYVHTKIRNWWSCHRCLGAISGYKPTAKDLEANPQAKEDVEKEAREKKRNEERYHRRHPGYA